jgi:hypothetical protein
MSITPRREQGDRTLRMLAYVVIGAVILWFLLPFIMAWKFGLPKDAGGVGDIFGGVNSLFSGLAFACLIVTVVLQMAELRQNTLELNRQANALNSQLEVMRLSAQITAIPVMLDQERRRLQLADVEGFCVRKLNQEVHSAAELKLLIQSTKSDRDKSHWEMTEAKRIISEIQRSSDTNVCGPDGIVRSNNQEAIRQYKRSLDSSEQAVKSADKVLPFLHKIAALMEELETAYAALSRSHTITNEQVR